MPKMTVRVILKSGVEFSIKCDKYAGIDIDAAISQKHEYNKSRPYRHGGKKC